MRRRWKVRLVAGLLGGLALLPAGAGRAGAQAQLSAVVCPVLLAQRAQVVTQFAALLAAFPQLSAVLTAQRDVVLAVIDAQLAGFSCIAQPTLSTKASGPAAVGDAVQDTAVLAGANNPAGGTITFRLFGPGDDTCAGQAVFTATVTVAGNGTYPSGPFTTTSAGVHRWVASYSGDGGSRPVSGACGDDGESVEVAAPPPSNPTGTTGTGTGTGTPLPGSGAAGTVTGTTGTGATGTGTGTGGAGIPTDVLGTVVERGQAADPSTGTGGVLPRTGAALLATVALGLLLVSAGATVLVARQREVRPAR